MSEIIKKYKKDDLEVIWQPSKCTHSAICATQLSDVFNPKNRPWVNMDGSDAESIINTVRKCPSKALSIRGDEIAVQENDVAESAVSIKVLKDGPALVSGSVMMTHADGTEEIKTNPALCRCGASARKPFCDGSHVKANFQG